MNYDEIISVHRCAIDAVGLAKLQAMLGNNELARVHWGYAYDFLSIIYKHGFDLLSDGDKMRMLRNLAVCAHQTLNYEAVISYMSEARKMSNDNLPDDLMHLELNAIKNQTVKKIIRTGFSR